MAYLQTEIIILLKTMSNIAVVVPTMVGREELYETFFKAWEELFIEHNVEWITVLDGDEPKVIHDGKVYLDVVPEHLRSNHSAGVRNYGFAYIAQHLPDVDYIITLDDDETPIGDPIQDHIDALNMRVPISWMSTTIVSKGRDYMRGFPYGVRTEAPVMLSHGVWEGVYDYDAPTQLHAEGKVEFYRGPIPKGALFPMCGMNLGFRREALPYMYFAPVGDYKGAERFDDIIGGLEIKKDFDALGWAVVTGYAKTNHNRASNVFTSLVREAVGIGKLEQYWKGEYDDWYREFLLKRNAWKKLCQ